MNTSAKQLDITKFKEQMLHLLLVDLYLNQRSCLKSFENARFYSSFEDKNLKSPMHEVSETKSGCIESSEDQGGGLVKFRGPIDYLI